MNTLKGIVTKILTTPAHLNTRGKWWAIKVEASVYGRTIDTTIFKQSKEECEAILIGSEVEV